MRLWERVNANGWIRNMSWLSLEQRKKQRQRHIAGVRRVRVKRVYTFHSAYRFVNCVDLNPYVSCFHIQNDLGILYQKTGQYDLAIEKFRTALRLDPAHLNSLFHIGLIYRYNKGENKKALVVFEELLSKNPDPRIAKMAAEEVKKIRAESGS